MSEVQRYISSEEVDTSITTAKAFPREVSVFRASLMGWATADEETAESCIFAMPRGGKTIEGPSIRFAELAASAWKNARAKAVIVDPGQKDPEFVTVEGQFWDLEANVMTGRQVKRRIVDKNGQRYNADMIGVTINAASSIALRNAILSGIPRSMWEGAYQAARRVVAGDAQTLANRRAAAVKFLANFGVREDMILATLRRKAIEDVDLDDLVTLRAAARAIKEGETTVEDAFVDPKVTVAKPKSGVEGLKESLAVPPAEAVAESSTAGERHDATTGPIEVPAASLSAPDQHKAGVIPETSVRVKPNKA